MTWVCIYQVSFLFPPTEYKLFLFFPPYFPAPLKLPASALFWAPGTLELQSRVSLLPSLLRTPAQCPSSVRCICQATSVSWHHDYRSKWINTGCLRGRKEIQDVEVQFWALMWLEASHLVISYISALQVCMVIVVVYLHHGYSVQSGWAITWNIYLQQVAHIKGPVSLWASRHNHSSKSFLNSVTLIRSSQRSKIPYRETNEFWCLKKIWVWVFKDITLKRKKKEEIVFYLINK